MAFIVVSFCPIPRSNWEQKSLIIVSQNHFKGNEIRPWHLGFGNMRFSKQIQLFPGVSGCHDVIMSNREVTKDTASEAKSLALVSFPDPLL